MVAVEHSISARGYVASLRDRPQLSLSLSLSLSLISILPVFSHWWWQCSGGGGVRVGATVSFSGGTATDGAGSCNSRWAAAARVPFFPMRSGLVCGGWGRVVVADGC
jgi:hypothetical protein